MSTIAPPLPTNPTGTETKAPTSPGTGNHHDRPRVIPRTSPTNAPMTQPTMSPVGPIVITGLLEKTNRRNCPLGSNTTARRRRRPNDGNDRPKRRQRPCQGSGKPIVEYRDRRRKIGRFSVNKGAGLFPGGLQAEVDRKTKRTARKAGYNTKGDGVRIEAELDSPKTLLERVLNQSPEEKCFYQVYAIEKRRICRCPDGSPCRRTTR